jgi:hypothetical protein
MVMSEDEKARKKEYLRKWNIEHKEEQAKKKREYRLRNAERFKALDKKRYDSKRDEILKQKKEYYDRTYVRTNTDWRPIIEAVKEELVKYEKLGIKPTLRTMFYRLFSLGKISSTDYQDLSERTTKAREYDIRDIPKEKRWFVTLPIDCFADTTREAVRYNSELIAWQPEKLVSKLINKLNKMPEDFKIPRWLNQPHYVEIWIEKKAMVSTFEGLTRDKEVPIVPLGGFHSVPYLYGNSNILKGFQGLVQFENQDDYLEPKQIHILYFGDLDPTGEEIETVLRDRLDAYGVKNIDFQRIGVTEEQITEFGLPTNLDKKTEEKLMGYDYGDKKKKGDSNVDKFKANHNDKLFQIEIDALPATDPERFSNLVIDSVDQYFDEEIYQQELAKYTPEKIRELVNNSIRSKFNIE